MAVHMLCKQSSAITSPVLTLARRCCVLVCCQYNYQLTETVNIAGYTLRLDVRTMGLIWYSCVIYWNDPILLELNPWLLPLIGNTTMVPIQGIVGCGSSDVAKSPVGSSLYTFIAKWQADNNDAMLGSCIANFTAPTSGLAGGATSLADATAQCIHQPQVFTQVSAVLTQAQSNGI